MDINKLEELRLKARNINIIGIVISVVLGIILVLITGMISTIMFGIIVGIIITSIITIKPTREFRLAYKNMFVLKGLHDIFNDLEYKPERGFDRSIIANTKMMNMGDRYSSNDYVSGKYKTISIEQADVHIEEEHRSTDSNGNTTTTWVTIFRGRWMIFDFNKNFKANIQVCQKGFGNARISNFFEKTKYKKVEMEDQDFNKKFRIYAQDEHDAFYILTPSLMEKIKKLSNTINGRLLFCFIDNKLHVGNQNGKDSFEHSIYKKINEQESVEQISNDIKQITSFVDELNLDNDLFRREV